MLPHSAPSVAMRTGSGVTCRSDAKALQMGLPGGGIGEVPVGLPGQAGDQRSGERPLAHVAQRGIVDDVIRVSREQADRGSSAGSCWLSCQTRQNDRCRSGCTRRSPFGGMHPCRPPSARRHRSGQRAARRGPRSESHPGRRSEGHDLALRHIDADLPRSWANSRGAVTCPWWYCARAKRRNSGPKCPVTPVGSGAVIVCPSGASQRSRRVRTR